MNIVPFLQIASAIDYVTTFVDLSVTIDKIDIRDKYVGVNCFTDNLDRGYYIESFDIGLDNEFTIAFHPDGTTILWKDLIKLPIGTRILLPLMIKSIQLSPNSVLLAESLYNGNTFDIPKSDWKYLSIGNSNRK